MHTFPFIANEPSLDFVNTEVILAGVRTDLLQSFGDLARWFAQANLASVSEMRRFARIWENTSDARAALRAARALRIVLRRAVERVARTGRIPNTLADVLTRGLQQPRLATDVVCSQGRLKTKPRWILEKPRDLVVPLAYSAANFFATVDYSAVRKCEDPGCILYFYDTSKNHSRRWCSMEVCGNRAKVAAYRERL